MIGLRRNNRWATAYTRRGRAEPNTKIRPCRNVGLRQRAMPKNRADRPDSRAQGKPTPYRRAGTPRKACVAMPGRQGPIPARLPAEATSPRCHRRVTREATTVSPSADAFSDSTPNTSGSCCFEEPLRGFDQLGRNNTYTVPESSRGSLLVQTRRLLALDCLSTSIPLRATEGTRCSVFPGIKCPLTKLAAPKHSNRGFCRFGHAASIGSKSINILSESRWTATTDRCHRGR
jgi:hypothetical protein